jgi:hypothetical protein
VERGGKETRQPKGLTNSKKRERDKEIVRDRLVNDLRGKLLRKGQGSGVSWAPDRRRYTYVAGAYDCASASADCGLYVGSVGTGSPRRIADAYAGARWSPDGRSIAAVDLDGWVFVTTPKGADKRRLRRGFDMAWAPAGGRLAVMGAQLQVIGRDGRNAKKLTNKPRNVSIRAWWTSRSTLVHHSEKYR